MAVDPVTKTKLSLTAEASPPELVALYHPSQLEKRFGGAAETPINFWPPYIGPKFIPNDDSSYLDIMDEDTYLKILA